MQIFKIKIVNFVKLTPKHIENYNTLANEK